MHVRMICLMCFGHAEASSSTCVECHFKWTPISLRGHLNNPANNKTSDKVWSKSKMRVSVFKCCKPLRPKKFHFISHRLYTPYLAVSVAFPVRSTVNFNCRFSLRQYCAQFQNAWMLVTLFSSWTVPSVLRNTSRQTAATAGDTLKISSSS